MNPSRILPLSAGLLATALLTATVSAQNVGIGTTTPKSKLSVNGSTASGGIAVGDATYTSTTGTVAPLNGAIIQGRVGIGTTSPNARLTLEGDGSVSNDSTIVVKSTATAVTPIARILLQSEDTTSLAANTTYGQLLFQALTGGNNSNATGLDVVHRGLSGGGPLTAMRFFTAGGTGQAERMRIDEDGNVGIGDTNPAEARLVVRGNMAGTVGANRQFTQANSTLVADAGIALGFSIYATNTIVAEGNVVAGNAIVAAASVTPSDVRLKNIIGKSDSASDLEKLGKIEVTDYTMKDPKALGSGVIKKVIAQQVAEVFPSAVTRGAGYLPDVQAMGTAVAKGDGLFEISFEAPHGLSAGQSVKLFTASGEPEFAMLETTGPNSFTAKLALVADGEKVFVHGRKVDDLRAVDYDAISMLNVSATQELAKNMAVLKAENADLKAQVADLKAANDKLGALSSEMEALKQAVATMRSKEEGPVRTVSLK